MRKSINYQYKTVALIFFLISGIFVFGQSKKELEAKKATIQKDIVYKNQLLQETKKTRELSVSQLVLLNKRIFSREELIRTINREIVSINKQINETNALIKSMEEDLSTLKDEYAKMIYYAYKNRSSYDKLMFVFSANDFNQAYKRLMYYQLYSKHREQQVILIKKAQEDLNKKIEDLKIKRIEKQSLLNQESEERNLLSKEKNEKESVVSALKNDENKLKKEIEKTKKEAVKLQKAIQKMIEEELALEAAKGKEALTPEAMALSGNFLGNKNKLPWPVEKGEITGRYGKQAHAILKGIEIQNNGIDITTTPGSVARAVFDGEVTKVMIIPGVGKVVMVRHGEYYTVYSNLKETFVQKGDKVKTKQEIGTIITDENKGITEMHFEIWKRQANMNPVDWIYKAK